MNDTPDNRTSPTRAALETEFPALRSEILKRIELRQQLISITLTLAAAFIGVGVTTATVSLVYPPLAAFLALAWSQNDFRIRQIAIFIRKKYENSKTGLDWETYMEQERQKSRLGAWRVLILSHGGVFLLTQVIAITVGFFRYTANPAELVLLGIDFAALLFVIWLLWRSK